jgi:citrate lyase subunit gamma (acyl carrier protein)
MEIVNKAQAGSFESSDILILAEPVEKGVGRTIDLNSDVLKQYGEDIVSLINKTLDKYSVSDIHLVLKDKGAINTVICARIETVLKRASNQVQGSLTNTI